MSVAQHSILVLHLRKRQAKRLLDRPAELRELLHDAQEGLIGFDPISPLKPFLGDAFKAVMEKLQQAVFLRYGLHSWTAEENKAHKIADRVAAASEAVHVAGWSAQEVLRVLKIRNKALELDPLSGIYGGQPWEPWPYDLAAERFLQELTRT